jgi:hypothetical protein
MFQQGWIIPRWLFFYQDLKFLKALCCLTIVLVCFADRMLYEQSARAKYSPDDFDKLFSRQKKIYIVLAQV